LERLKNKIEYYHVISARYPVSCQREQTMYFEAFTSVLDSLGDRRALWNNRKEFRHVTGGFAGSGQGTE
jgi:hypothetical protein